MPPSRHHTIRWEPSGTGCSSASTMAPTSISTKPTTGDGTSCTASSNAYVALVERILPGGTRDECIDQLNLDPRYVVEGADNFLAWSQGIVDRTIDDLDGVYFDIPEPLLRCQAMAAPAGGPDTTYYTAPSEDFSRPGQIWHQVAGKTTSRSGMLCRPRITRVFPATISNSPR